MILLYLYFGILPEVFKIKTFIYQYLFDGIQEFLFRSEVENSFPGKREKVAAKI
jgi:hypothetical protein